MVGRRRQCDADQPSQEIWKNTNHEHGGGIFFSKKSDKLFEGLAIWEYDKFRKLQGTYPVISLSFANVKERDYSSTIQRINQIIVDLYHDYGFLRESDALLPEEKNI